MGPPLNPTHLKMTDFRKSELSNPKPNLNQKSFKTPWFYTKIHHLSIVQKNFKFLLTLLERSLTAVTPQNGTVENYSLLSYWCLDDEEHLIWREVIDNSKEEHLENQNLLKSRTVSFMLQAIISYWGFDKKFFIITIHLGASKWFISYQTLK